MLPKEYIYAERDLLIFFQQMKERKATPSKTFSNYCSIQQMISNRRPDIQLHYNSKNVIFISWN